MLINSTAASAVHHYLLLFVYGKTTFSSWQVIFSRYWVKVYSRNLDKYIISRDIKVQILQVVVYIIDKYVYALITSTSNSEMFIVEMQPYVSFRSESIEKLC